MVNEEVSLIKELQEKSGAVASALYSYARFKGVSPLINSYNESKTAFGNLIEGMEDNLRLAREVALEAETMVSMPFTAQDGAEHDVPVRFVDPTADSVDEPAPQEPDEVEEQMFVAGQVMAEDHDALRRLAD